MKDESIEDKSYFDVKCEEYYFDRNYLHYLHPIALRIVLILCSSKITKKKACEEINKIKPFREYTVYRLDNTIREIRIKLIQLKFHAETFTINDRIIPASYSQLKRIVEDYEEKQNNDAVDIALAENHKPEY